MNQPNKDQMRHILEGLLAHCFSVHCNSYNDGDIKFFLKMANQQRRWLATYGMDDVVGVSYILQKPVSISSHTGIHPSIQVEVSDDLLDMTPSLSSLLESPLQKLGSYIPQSVYKLYLHRMLLRELKRNDDSAKCVMLFFHKTKVVINVAGCCSHDSPCRFI